MKCGKWAGLLMVHIIYLKYYLGKFSNKLFDTVDKSYRNIIPNDVIDTIITRLPLRVF